MEIRNTAGHQGSDDIELDDLFPLGFTILRTGCFDLIVKRVVIVAFDIVDRLQWRLKQRSKRKRNRRTEIDVLKAVPIGAIA